MKKRILIVTFILFLLTITLLAAFRRYYAVKDVYAGSSYEEGLRHEYGQGVPRDFKQAYMWYTIAVSYGNTAGTARKERLMHLMTPEDISASQKAADEWVRTHGSIGKMLD